MGALRAPIIAALSAPGVLPADIDVIPYARNIDPPDRTTVMVRVDDVEPSKTSQGTWTVTGALVIVAAKTAPGDGDDEVEDALMDVLVAVESPDITPGINWTKATRGTYPVDNPTNPAYDVAVTLHIAKD
jgi:hypothetical protein